MVMSLMTRHQQRIYEPCTKTFLLRLIESSWFFSGRAPRHYQYRNLVALEMLISPSAFKITAQKKTKEVAPVGRRAADRHEASKPTRFNTQRGHTNIQTKLGDIELKLGDHFAESPGLPRKHIKIWAGPFSNSSLRLCI